MDACGNDHQREKQKCAICLEDLFPTRNNTNNTPASARTKQPSTTAKGDLFHDTCIHAWHSAQRQRLSSSRASRSRLQNALICNCPLCNKPAQTFVKLFLDDDQVDQDEANSSNACLNSVTTEKGCAFASTSHTTTNVTTTAENNQAEPQQGPQTVTTEALLANQERIQTKLKRYKRKNKNLKQELQSERADMEEMLVSTIQNFYKIIDKHEEERQHWSRGALDLRRELDTTLEQHSKERREWNHQQTLLQQELQMVQKDCARAEHKVQSATEGLAEWKRNHAQQQSKLQVLMQEKSKLVHENRKLKKAVLTSHGAIRSENASGSSAKTT